MEQPKFEYDPMINRTLKQEFIDRWFSDEERIEASKGVFYHLNQIDGETYIPSTPQETIDIPCEIVEPTTQFCNNCGSESKECNCDNPCLTPLIDGGIAK
jgi:hypothetical protein